MAKQRIASDSLRLCRCFWHHRSPGGFFMLRSWRVVAVTLLMALASCSGNSDSADTGPSDQNDDSGQPMQHDAGSDAGGDAGSDAGGDAGFAADGCGCADSGPDAGQPDIDDGGPDSDVDAGLCGPRPADCRDCSPFIGICLAHGFQTEQCPMSCEGLFCCDCYGNPPTWNTNEVDCEPPPDGGWMPPPP